MDIYGKHHITMPVWWSNMVTIRDCKTNRLYKSTKDLYNCQNHLNFFKAGALQTTDYEPTQ